MKKKHENTIFPSSPDTPFFVLVYKFVLTEYQNVVLFPNVTFYTSQGRRASWVESR
jgi:hypothetical protein